MRTAPRLEFTVDLPGAPDAGYSPRYVIVKLSDPTLSG